MDIGYVLTRAWQIIWKHKILWIFGILAGCGSGGNSGGGGGTSGGGGDGGYQGNLPPQIERFLEQFQGMSDGQIALVVVIGILIGLLVFAITVFLGTIGRVGLMRGTLQVEGGAEKLTFGELFSGSMPYFWRVFGLKLLVGLVILVLVLIFTVPAIIAGAATMGIFFICLIPLLCLLIPLSLVVNLIIEQSTIAIVVEDLGIRTALNRGWEVVRGNLGTMIIMLLILWLAVGFIGGIIIALPMLIVVVPAVIGMSSGSSDFFSGGMIIALVCCLAYLPFLLVFQGILYSYIETAWTLTFMRLTGKTAAVQPPLISNETV